MALVTGRVTKVGIVGAVEPAGRLTVSTNDADPNALTAVQCTTGPKFSLALLAFDHGWTVEIDVLSSNPMVADKIRVV